MQETDLKSLRNKQAGDMKETGSQVNHASVSKDVDAPKKKRARKLFRFSVLFVFVFLVGGLGGVWLDRIFIPTMLVKYPDLNQYDLLKRVNERTTIVREIENINISQEEAISEAIDRVLPSVTGIFIENAAGKSEKVGAGIILTSDGYIIAPDRSVYATADALTIKVELKDGNNYAASVVNRNTDYGLAILKIEAYNLSVIPYASTDDLRLGQKLIIIDDAIATDVVSQFIEDYVAEDSTDSSFQERIRIVQDLEESFAGAAVIDLEGKLVGVAEEDDLIIPLSEFQDFIEESIAG